MSARIPMFITAFQTPAEADAAFVAEWERAVQESRALHRALRADVDFRFVGVTLAQVPPGLPSEAHRGSYEVAHQDGDPDGHGGVVRITFFDVPAPEDATFLDAWRTARALLVARPGSLGARLYRSDETSRLRFVELARWSSPLMIARTLQQPELTHATTLPFTSRVATYLVVAP